MARRPDEEIMLEQVPDDGSPIGNITLRATLGWDDEKYWKVRSGLLSHQLIGLRKGKGGAVYRIIEDEIEPVPTPAALPEEYKDEASLYQPFLESIRDKYLPDIEVDRYVIQITAGQGRRATGGTWTRPDVTLITVDVYQYIPEKTLSVITFELKMPDSFDVPGVFEAASHTRFSNRSYLVGYIPGGIIDAEAIDRIKQECERFNIGLVTFINPKDYSTYEFHVEPSRRTTDPALINEFIQTQINDENKQKLSTFIK